MIIAVDPGKKSGWAVWDDREIKTVELTADRKRLPSDLFVRNGNLFAGNAKIRDGEISCMVDLVKSFSPFDTVLIEQQFLGGFKGAKGIKFNPMSYQSITESRMLWQVYLGAKAGKNLVKVYPSQWRSKTIGTPRREEGKEISRRLAAESLFVADWEDIDEDTADAVNILKWWMFQNRGILI